MSNPIASPIASIEDAIIRRISEAKLPYLRTLTTYGGELDGENARVVRAFPAIWVAFQGAEKAKAVGTSKQVYHVSASFVVLVAARNLRNEASTRKGDALQVGTYQMLENVRSLLHGQDFASWSLQIEALELGRVRSLFNGQLQDQGLSVYAQEWHTKYAVRVGDNDGVASLPDFTAIDLRYHLLPDDGVVDAVDKLKFTKE